LSITGEDRLDVSQKYEGAVNGRLGTRCVVMSNPVLDFKDESGVVVSRLVTGETRYSFADDPRLDPDLPKKLFVELPGILNGALDALDGIRARRGLTQPSSGLALRQEMLKSTDVVIRWALEECEMDGGAEVQVSELYEGFRDWCRAQSIRDYPDSPAFSRRLHAMNGVTEGERHVMADGSRGRSLRGIKPVDHVRVNLAEELRQAPVPQVADRPPWPTERERRAREEAVTQQLLAQVRATTFRRRVFKDA